MHIFDHDVSYFNLNRCAPNDECFGLLGINSAGKSTTLSILSGALPPSAGEAFVGGLSLSTDVHSCRRKIGFCPQFDASFELLMGREGQ